jgi:carbonic anhydrase
VVRARIASGSLGVHAWFYDVATGEIEAWSSDAERWQRLDARMALPAASPA